MEQESGCKISIRGKGSAKEGSKGRASKSIDEDDELHVHISGESEENVEKAVKMVEDLLKPKDDEALNEHKQKQLRELALINGTLREDEYCPVCGEKGHRQFECPHRSKSFKAAGVKCAICGDLSHPTRDCPLKQDDPSNANTLDSEYDSFLAELGGGAPKSQTACQPPLQQTTKDYSQSLSESTPHSVPDSGGLAAGKAKGSGPVILAPIVNIIPLGATKSASSSTRPPPRPVAVSGTVAASTPAPAPPVPDQKPRQQTVIRVTTVMTGDTPPVFASTNVAADPHPPLPPMSALPPMPPMPPTAVDIPSVPVAPVPAGALMEQPYPSAPALDQGACSIFPLHHSLPPA